MKKKMHSKVHNEQLLGENKLYGKLFDLTSLLPIQGIIVFVHKFQN